MYTASTVAEYVIRVYHAIERPITNLQLQKLLYFIQGEASSSLDERFISDDFFAWKLGPVVPSVYFKYSIFAGDTLPILSRETKNSINPEHQKRILEILSKYIAKSSWQLVDLSHKQKPWRYHFEHFGEKSIIPFDSIFSFFKEQVRYDKR